MTQTCPKCQSENPEIASFCQGCGTKLISPEGIEVTETLQAPKEELTTGSTFAGRYQIIEQLGKGGMGKVYKALDTEIKEKVAIKLIKPEISADKNTIERFRNELKFARKISHRNVCRMYDLNKEEGSYYITMEYVSGEDLKSFIRRSRRLDIETAVSIAKGVCEGLSEAHRLGVIHRDLKPSNIMIDRDGDARIMDFGIARSLTGRGITDKGVMIGTPDYMSPEQVDGKDIDQRTDIYSLGVILYEMVTGQRPFEGETALSVARKQADEIPREPKEINPQIPDDLNSVILKCLEKDRERRYQSAGDLRAELENIEKGIPTTDRVVPKRKPLTSREITVTFGLKRLLAPVLVLIAVVIIGVVIWKLLPEKEPVSPLSDKPSVAILPFVDLSPGKDQEYFCDGMTEELINRLSNISELKVPARTSVFFFKGKDQDIREIGKKLGVATVLEGSIQKVETKLRARVQLINIADGFHVWSEEYDRELKDVFDIQDEIALAVVDKLKLTLLGDEKVKLSKHHAIDPVAYEAYLKGLFYLWQQSEEGTVNALRHFSRVIEIEPNYAPAHAGVALTYVWASTFLQFWSPLEGVPKGKEAAQRAIQLDSTLSDGYVAMGYARANFDWDWAGAEKDFRRAVELSPHSPLALDGYANFLVTQGRFDEALAVLNRALELDPHSPLLHHDLGWTYWSSDRFDLAMPLFRKALELERNFHQSRDLLGWSYLLTGKPAEALAEFQTVEQLAPDLPWVLGSLGYLYGVTGRPAEARKVLAKLDKLSRKRYVTSWSQAFVYLGLGQKDIALDWLEKACEEHDGFMWTLNVDPWNAPLRNEPRFQALVKKVGLDK